MSGGALCSAPQKPPPSPRRMRTRSRSLTKQEKEAIRNNQIRAAVSFMPVAHIGTMYRSLEKTNFYTYGIDPGDIPFFKKCISEQFEIHREQIEKMEADSRERYRAVIQASIAQNVNSKRKRRIILTQHVNDDILGSLKVNLPGEANNE